MSADELQKLLPERSEQRSTEVRQTKESDDTPTNEGKDSLYRSLPFTIEDRNCIIAVMKASGLAFDNRKHHGWLVPDVLQAVPIGRSQREHDPFRKVKPVKLEAEYLPEKVFLDLIADWYADIDKPEEECYRNEVQFRLKVKNKMVPVLVRAVLSPPDCVYPYLEVFVANPKRNVRKELVRRIDNHIRESYRREYGSDDSKWWIGEMDPSERRRRQKGASKGASGGIASEIDHWSDLGIAIHSTSRETLYYAFNPRPQFGDVVYLSRGRRIEVRGDQLPDVLSWTAPLFHCI